MPRDLRDRATTLSLVPDTQPGVRIYAACQSGPCRQGKFPCPTPLDCQIAEGYGYDSDALELIGWMLIGCGLCVLIGIAFLAAPYISGWFA